MAETVSVSAEVALTPLNSGEKSATLTSEQIENIPIVGTSAAEVLRLLPGMTPSTNGTSNKPNFTRRGLRHQRQRRGGGQQSAVGNYSANGNRTWALDITIDGAPGARPRLQLRDLRQPEHRVRAGVQGPAVELLGRAREGPGGHDVISKSGGRDFHGSVFGYLRDYKLNSNEWFANKVGAERVKNKFIYPGFTISGPLLIPGTSFNKNRDKVFFFARLRVLRPAPRHRLRQVVGPDDADAAPATSANSAARRAPAASSTPVPNLPGGIVPQSQIDPGGQALLNLFQQPNADPATTGGYNYVDNFLLEPERLAGPRAPRLQHLRQHEAVRCATTSSARRSPSRSACGGGTASASSRTRPRSAGRTAPTRSRPA